MINRVIKEARGLHFTNLRTKVKKG